LPSSEGVLVTFQVINADQQVISGVEVNVTKSGDLVATGTTDAAGAITFFLDPDTTYVFTYVKEGFETFTESLAPSAPGREYTVTLGSSTVTTLLDFNKGISYIINPATQYLVNDTDYTFNFILSSSFWDVTSFGFVLTNNTGASLGDDTVNSNGGTATDTLNSANHTHLKMDYFWIIDGNYSNGTYSWSISSDAGTGFGVTNFFSRLKTYADAGIFGLETGGFAMALISFLLIFVVTGIMSFKYGLNSPAAVMGIAFTVTLFLNVGIDVIPLGQSLLRFFPTVFMGLLFAGTLFRENFR